MPVYASYAHLYKAAGWPCVFPLPPGQKEPPLRDFTGNEGRDTTIQDLAQFAHSHPEGNIALRMPDGVIGIDVDHYDKVKPNGTVVHKRGGDMLAELEGRLGPLPPTWRSSARELPTGIRFYRVPPGKYRTTIGDAIEVIQRHHRYAVVWPSTNPDAGGAPYGWSDPWGGDAFPHVDRLPELPEAWVAFLREGAAGESTPLGTYDDGTVMLTALMADLGQPCGEGFHAGERALRKLHTAAEGSRHDAMTAGVHDIVHTGAKGHRGTGHALHALHDLWADLTAGEPGRDVEFDRAALGSARKAVTLVHRAEPVTLDPCLLINVTPIQPATAVDQRPAAVAAEQGPLVPAPAAAAPWSARLVIGADVFDPRETYDQGLADRALDRLYPAMRYCTDLGMWVLRRADRWDTEPGGMERWGLRVLAEMMPLGDLEADKDTDEYRRAKRRAKLMMNGTVSGVAAKMRDAVAASGEHPMAIRAADLDADPEILWAGGIPWDLRRSMDRPEPAQWLPPDTVHLHSCAVAPADVPTPRWDAFLRAVLPDPEIRAWALRVLSVAVTGHADRTLPLLQGETGQGKTQLVHLIMSLLGSYAHAADPRLLTATDKAHASIVYDLKGRRLSFVDEGPRGGELARERLKQLSGGGSLTGNPMRGNPVTFVPSHTLVLTSNPEPEVADPAIRSRVRLIPCTGDPDEVARTRAAITGEAWQQEAPGVLAMLVREASRWVADRTSSTWAAAPAALRAGIEELADEQDPVGGWLVDATAPFEQGTKARDLYRSFVAWCDGMRLRNIPNNTAWGRRLSTLGYPADHRRDGKYRPLMIKFPGSGGPPPGPPVQRMGNHVSAGQHGFVTGFRSLQDQTQVDLRPNGVSAGQPEVLADAKTVTGIGDGLPEPVTAPNPSHEKTTGGSTKTTASSLSEQEGGTCSNGRDQSTGHMRPVEGLTVHEDVSAGQPEFSTASVTSVTSFLLDTTPPPPPPHTQHIEGNKGNRSTRHGTPAVEEADGPFKLIKKSRPRLTPEERAARAAERKRIKDAERAAAKVAKDVEQAAARAAAIEQLSGAVIGLPAIMRRGAEPESVTVAAAAVELMRQITETGVLTVDVEHTGYPAGHALHALRTVQLGDDTTAVVLDAQQPAQADLATAALGAVPALQAFSAAADLVPLAHAGLVDAEDAWRRMHDVTIPAKLDSPAGLQNGADLKGLAGSRLSDPQSPSADAAREALFKAGGWQTDTEPDTPFAKSGWAQVDHARATMVRYDASDVLDCAALAKAIPAPPDYILERERRVEHVVSRVAHIGLKLDSAKVEALIPREEDALAQARARLMVNRVDNGKSTQQVGRWLVGNGVTLPLTNKGNPSTAEGVLENLKHTLPEDSPVLGFVDDVLDYREHATALSLFLRPWRELCVRGDGRSRSTVYTLGAATGRMSCVRFNLQQITREGGYRACIVADPGYRFVSADFSSVEVRCMAALSGDPTLRELIMRSEEWEAQEHPSGERNPYDLHNVVAELAFGPDWTKRDRYMVKRGVFGWAYGGSIPTLAAQVGCSQSVMGVIVDSLGAIAPDYVRWSDEVKHMVRRGAVEFPTYAGRVIKLDKRSPHKAPNYLIQGTARELLVDALLRWDESRFGGGVVVPVHDEILAMVPAAEASEAQTELARCMRTELHGVPIAVGVDKEGPSSYWRDAA